MSTGVVQPSLSALTDLGARRLVHRAGTPGIKPSKFFDGVEAPVTRLGLADHLLLRDLVVHLDLDGLAVRVPEHAVEVSVVNRDDAPIPRFRGVFVRAPRDHDHAR